MSAVYGSRIQRLNRLEGLLPKWDAKSGNCLGSARLLELLGDAYSGHNDAARRRALQRDLSTLVKEGRVEAVNPGSRPLLYRRTADECDWSDDAAIWGYALQNAFDLIAETVPKRHLDLLWERVLYGRDIQLLSRRQLRMVPDSLRLRPAELHPTVLKEVIEAMARGLALKVTYENANGDRSKPTIHPQALIQRGPIPYLFALKEDEDDLRTYALHRMIKAEHLPDTPVREADDFDLDQAIAEGKIDFGDGPPIELKIRARGYIAELLRVCPLSDDQRIFDEPDDSDFTVGIEACVLENGQLLRWLLSAGENLEVVAPDELRHTVSEQARKMADLYSQDVVEATGSQTSREIQDENLCTLKKRS